MALNGTFPSPFLLALEDDSSCYFTISSSLFFLCQQTVCSLMALLTTVLLKPVGIPPMVSQFLAAILLGPTFMGKITGFTDLIFPHIGYKFLKVYTEFGMILQMFCVGTQIDTKMLVNPERKILAIGISIVALPLTLAYTAACLLSKIATLDSDDSTSLKIVAYAQSMSSFPVIACYLHELKIINSEFSRAAFLSSMISGFISNNVQVIFREYVNYKKFGRKKPVGSFILKAFSWYVVVFVVIVFLFRKVIKWIIEEVPQGHKIKEGYISAVILMPIMIYWVCYKAEIYAFFGSFLFGIIIPTGPPLGSAIVERLHFFTTWMVMPVWYTLYSRWIDLRVVDFKTGICVGSVILISLIGKFLGALLPALHYNMSFVDATLLGITINAQGFMEIAFTKRLETYGLLTSDSHNIMCVTILVVTGSSAPLVQWLYKSSLSYNLQYARNIQQSERKELRVLACLFDEENVPPIIHFLKAISHPNDSPVIASIVHFIELIGRSAPVIVSHKVGKKASDSNLLSQRILNVFKQLEKTDKGITSMQPYTVTAPYMSMHVDMCMLSIKERASFIILPFHEQSSTGMNINIKTVNCNILENAPCSVGLIIDRGRLGGLKYVIENWITYKVIVFFFGGVDDWEALALAERMLGNKTVHLTIVRFYKVDDIIDNTFDNEMMNEFLRRNGDNYRMTYIQEKVHKCLDVVRVIEAIPSNYELVLLGRRQDENSLLVELATWVTYPELGLIGDMFMTSDYGRKATLLVVQHHLNTAKSE